MKLKENRGSLENIIQHTKLNVEDGVTYPNRLDASGFDI